MVNVGKYTIHGWYGLVKIEIFPKVRGDNKKYLKPPPRQVGQGHTSLEGRKFQSQYLRVNWAWSSSKPGYRALPGGMHSRTDMVTGPVSFWSLTLGILPSADWNLEKEAMFKAWLPYKIHGINADRLPINQSMTPVGLLKSLI